MTDDNIIPFDHSIDAATTSTTDDLLAEDQARIAHVRTRLETVNEMFANIDKCCDMWQTGASYTVADIDMVERLVHSMEDVLYVGTKSEDEPHAPDGYDRD